MAGAEGGSETDPESTAESDAEDATESDVGSETESDAERTVIRTGREFEREYRLDAGEAGEFLIDLGRQLRDGDELTIADEEWELPFAFGEPVDVEIDFDGVGEPELEVELKLPGRPDERAPSIE